MLITSNETYICGLAKGICFSAFLARLTQLIELCTLCLDLSSSLVLHIVQKERVGVELSSLSPPAMILLEVCHVPHIISKPLLLGSVEVKCENIVKQGQRAEVAKPKGLAKCGYSRSHKLQYHTSQSSTSNS